MRTEIQCQDVVVGTGMQGFAAAKASLASGRNCVVLERSSRVGGVLQPVELNGIPLDPGCHLWLNSKQLDGTPETRFIEEHLGLKMIPVMGHCYLSVSEDGVSRPKLEGPSFEHLPVQIRHDAKKTAASLDLAGVVDPNLGVVLEQAFGPRIARSLLAFARKLYQRDPSDLSMQAAGQMLISRIKLHTCEELEAQDPSGDLGDMLYSHPLDGKRMDFPKFFYPEGGLGSLLARIHEWLESNTSELLFKSSPVTIESGTSGGCLLTRDHRIQFERMAWCCNPLELARLLGIETPDKHYTAGSQSRSMFFRVASSDPEVLYSHDFNVDSPMFRSWIPPKEMTSHIGDTRHVIVECPGAKESSALIEDLTRRVSDIHDLRASDLEFLGSKAQVRFYPTLTYNRWLGSMVTKIRDEHSGIVIPDRPLYGKSAIAEWWAGAF